MVSPEEVVVVVPTHTAQFHVFEEISLTQLFRVLGKYPIRFAIPESLDFHYEAEGGAPYGIERFPDHFFASWVGYNELCEDPAFYGRFSDYKYMLIYQTDAFVFSDRLLEFCDMGYDYFGPEETDIAWPDHHNRIGNGGFSLRRIEAMRFITERKDFIRDTISERLSPIRAEEILRCEDQFFSYAAEIEELKLNWPPRSANAQFGQQHNVNDNLVSFLQTALPFGCHYWFKMLFDIWWPVISGYGYDATEKQKSKWTNSGTDYNVWLLHKQILSGHFHEICYAFFDRHIPARTVRLWGNGSMGRGCKEVFAKLDVKIETVFDRQNSKLDVLVPTLENLRSSDTPIIVSTTRFEEEIDRELSDMGFEKGREYFLWRDIAEEWIAQINASGGSIEV